MQARTKVVELNKKRYTLRRLPPDVGSFIFMRMMGINMRVAQAEQEREQDRASNRPTYGSKLDTVPQKPTVPEVKPSGEAQIRALSFIVMSGGIPFEDFQFIQRSCLKVVSRIDTMQGQEFPIPIMADSGQWADLDIADNISLVMSLTTEVLVHSFADFFDTTTGGS